MTNEEIIENGRRLFQSAENLRKSAPDLDALMGSLWEAVEETKFFGEIVDLGDEDTGGDGEWLAPAYAYNAAVLSYPERLPGQLGANKKPKPIGTLTFIMRLCNSGGAEEHTVKWPWLDQACLILGWHPKYNTKDNWEIDNFNPEDENIAAIIHIGNGLWAWREQEENYAYFFTIPIFALRNENDLRRFALVPLKRLFNSDDPVLTAEEVLSGVPVLQP
jgi:hypothetical protein